jgi:hypothetical protein
MTPNMIGLWELRIFLSSRITAFSLKWPLPQKRVCPVSDLQRPGKAEPFPWNHVLVLG